MPTDISHYPGANGVLFEFLDAKIPLTCDDLERRLSRLDGLEIQDALDGLHRIGMLRRLQGDDDPYVLTTAALESADLFGMEGWSEDMAFWQRWRRTERRMAFREALPAQSLAAFAAGGVAVAGAALLRRRAR